MYDFYPEWGPARHRDEELVSTHTTRYWSATATADVRDASNQRPDDN